MPETNSLDEKIKILDEFFGYDEDEEQKAFLGTGSTTFNPTYGGKKKIVDSVPDTLKLMRDWLRKQTGKDIRMSTKAVIKNMNGEVLIIKDAYSDYWDLPGGHVKDEETIEESLKREVKEESGIDLVHPREFMTTEMTLGKETKPVTFFLTSTNNENVKLSEEHTDYKWITRDEVDNYNLGKFSEIVKDCFDDKVFKSMQSWLEKREMTPPFPGAVFDSQKHRWVQSYHRDKLITHSHLWERASRIGFSSVKEGIKTLHNTDLPDAGWWHAIRGDGYIVGRGNVVKTVLSASMHPNGVRV